MSNETPILTSAPPAADPPPPAPAVPAKPPRAGGSRLVPVLAVGVLVSLGATVWVWNHDRRAMDELRREFATRLGEGDGIAREARAAARQGQEAIADLQQRLARAESSLAETQGQQAAIDALYQALSRTREDQLLVEVEQTVALASQQLQLAGNVEAALVALRGAENRLAQIDAAPLVLLRKALAADIETLAGTARPDVPGTALKLELLQAGVERWPLAFMAPPAAADKREDDAKAGSSLGEKARRLARELWAELRTLIRIERLDRPDPALLSPSQEVFLRENLRLRLLSARLGLLARDGRSFANDLAMAEAWLQRYFDTESDAVARAIEDVRKLAALDLAGDQVPTLHETLTALRSLQRRPAPSVRSEAPARPAGPAPAAR